MMKILSYATIIISLCCSAQLARSCAPCGDVTVNLLTIYDRSTSVLQNDPDAKINVKEFLKDVHRGLNLGSNAVITSLIDFASHPVVQYTYADAASTDISLIENIIDGIANPDGNTNIHKAFESARVDVIPTLPVDRVGSCHICNVTLVLTDGQFEDPEELTAELQAYTQLTHSKFCVVEFRDRSADTFQQRFNRDANLEQLKGDTGSLIGNMKFANNEPALATTLACVCNACKDCDEEGE